MTMYDSTGKLKEEFKELFKDGMTPRQVWWVVKMMKAARLYCRSNVAFNNFPFSEMLQNLGRFLNRTLKEKDIQDWK